MPIIKKEKGSAKLYCIFFVPGIHIFLKPGQFRLSFTSFGYPSLGYLTLKWVWTSKTISGNSDLSAVEYWYKTLGFVPFEIKTFNHLPFDVLFMQYPLDDFKGGASGPGEK